jgi:hypothetical protein
MTYVGGLSGTWTYLVDSVTDFDGALASWVLAHEWSVDL